MFKESKNPIVAELTKSHKRRSINLATLRAIVVELPDHKAERRCAWCTENKLNHGNQKYCSTLCSQSAMAWAYPQKEEALYFLLERQNWKCFDCQFQYVKPTTSSSPHFLIKRFKKTIAPERKPEVDHTIPISKDGTALGLSNHTILCFTCHKKKTKIDNSGPRKKK